ncbi:MAG: hypothetical protein ACKVWV_13965 [Planctomycetota bacterium]
MCGRQNASFSFVSVLHVIASVGAGALSGMLLGGLGFVALGTLAPAPWIVSIALAVICFAYAGFHAGLYRLPMPCLRRQVRHGWRFLDAPWTSIFYGVGLGSGLHVHIRFAGLYVVTAGSVLSASPRIGAALFGLYGLCRALPVPVFGALHRDPAQTESTFTWLSDERNFGLRRLRAWSLLVVGLWLVAVAWIRS